MIDTRDIFDPFSDGSAIEFIRTDGDLHTHSHGDLTVHSGTVEYVSTRFGHAIKPASGLDVRLDDPDMLSGLSEWTLTAYGHIRYVEDGVVCIDSFLVNGEEFEFVFSTEIDLSVTGEITSVLVKRGDKIYFYCCGILVAESSNLTYSNPDGLPPQISFANEDFNTSQFRIFNRALSDCEARAIMNERRLSCSDAAKAEISTDVAINTSEAAFDISIGATATSEAAFDISRATVAIKSPMFECGVNRVARVRVRANIAERLEAVVVKSHD